MAVLESLIAKCDCFGWVPTIRGALALDLVDGKSLLGDVDKYAASISDYSEFKSSRYVIATSLVNVDDSKTDNKDNVYVRTERYYFAGAINDDIIDRKFLSACGLGEDKQLCKYMADDGLLFGRLIIDVVKPCNPLTENEISFIHGIQSLCEKKKQYDTDYFRNAVDMSKLADTRKEMVSSWIQLYETMNAIGTRENKLPVFIFDVILTRDGILLLKDRTPEKYRDKYAAKDTCCDYTQNVPLHRLFKTAMNYIKYLFHCNYHHNETNDTYLPASNLHPAKRGARLDMTGIFRHQLDAFLTPVTRAKRKGFKSYAFDIKGILLYARSYINVMEHNGLVDDARIKKAKAFLETQEAEVDHMTQSRRTLVNNVLAQRNFLVVTTGVLALVVAIIKISQAVVVFEPVSLAEKFDRQQLLTNVIIIIGLITISWSMFEIYHNIVLRRRFKRKKQSWFRRGYNSVFLRNSNLKKRRFSWWYKSHLGFLEFRRRFSQYIRELAITVLTLVLILLAFAAVLYLYFGFIQ